MRFPTSLPLNFMGDSKLVSVSEFVAVYSEVFEDLEGEAFFQWFLAVQGNDGERVAFG